MLFPWSHVSTLSIFYFLPCSRSLKTPFLFFLKYTPYYKAQLQVCKKILICTFHDPDLLTLIYAGKGKFVGGYVGKKEGGKEKIT